MNKTKLQMNMKQCDKCNSTNTHKYYRMIKKDQRKQLHCFTSILYIRKCT